jgi:hypothetical protein
MLFVLVGWVLFRAADFSSAWHILRAMVGVEGFGKVAIADRPVVFIGLAVALIGPTSQKMMLDRLRPNAWAAGVAAAALVFALLAIGGRLQNDFIYFQF